ncbi:F-box domain-containing protein [Colletotrichum incanum]|nr:F-box domain-containing protein [Colletotrichum incanum]
MPDLPDEIVATIATKLDYRDALHCTRVSKEWRRAWTADLVVKDVARAHFSGLIESHPEASPWSLLQPVAAKATARAQGRYVSFLSITTAGSSLLHCTALKLDDRSLDHAKYNPIPAEPAARDSHTYRRQSYYGYAYCDGRIAWQWDAYSFFIDDIRGMTRTLASPSDLVVKGEKDFVVSGLSKTLLVLANSRTERALIVYHLEKNQYRRVTLPSRMHEINLHNETFVVTFHASLAEADPHVWRWGGGLAKLKVPNFSDTQDRDLDRISFEHLSQDATCETRKCFIMIYKFDHMKYVQTFSYVTTMVDRSGSLRLSLRCRPMNPYGLYNLCALFEHTSAKVVHCKPPGAKSMQTPRMTLFLINFNTINETFSYDTRELYGMRRPYNWASEPSNGIVWNDLTYYIQSDTAKGEDDVSPDWEHEVKARGVRSLCIADKSSTLVISEDSSWFSEGEGTRSIAVDDDFLVAISDKEYIAWNFGDFGLRDDPWKCSPRLLGRLRLQLSANKL